jgi:hypothetical protein
MKFEVFDNVLSLENFNLISNTMSAFEFPWHLSRGKSHSYEGKQDKRIFQFIHFFYKDFSFTSPYANILDPLLEALQPVSLIRIKANLTTITPEIIQYDFHRDVNLNSARSKTAIYYLNTNNGRTIFNSGEEVESIANRLVIFDSDNLHKGTSCTDEPFRVVINFNYFTHF